MNTNCNCGLDLSKHKSGLGPNSWNNLRHYLPYHKEFHISASGHDSGYSVGGDSTDKFIIDQVFLNRMLECKTGSFYPFVYYYFVRIFGGLFYKYKTSD